MIATVTRSSYYLNNGNPDVLVDDKTFIAIIKSRKMQLEILDKLNMDAIKIGRLGRDAGDYFIKGDNDLDINLTVGTIVKEYGIYAEI